MITVGATVYANKSTENKTIFYAQFRNGGDYLNVPRKDLYEGVESTFFQVQLTGNPTTLNFLLDVKDSTVIAEFTNFYLAINSELQPSGQLPIGLMKEICDSKAVNNDSYSLNNNALINFHLKETKLKLKESSQLSIGFIGDSWTHAANRYSGSVASLLASELGDAGAGWIGFGALIRLDGDKPYIGLNGNARPSLYSLSLDDVDKWNLSSASYYNSLSPDLGAAASNIAGAKLTLTGTKPLSYGKIFYMRTEGVFRYRFDSAPWWTTVDANKWGALNILDLQNLPKGNSWTFELEVLSGECKICGIDVRNSITWNGVVTHKLGATGSTSRSWASIPEADFVKSIKALNLDTAFILLGTNDQKSLTTSEFKVNVQVMINRLKLAYSAIDIVLVAPCENQRENSTPMSSFSSLLRELALVNNVGFLDLQTAFGNKADDYGYNSERPLFSDDLIHPDPLTGGRVITSSIWRFMNN